MYEGNLGLRNPGHFKGMLRVDLICTRTTRAPRSWLRALLVVGERSTYMYGLYLILELVQTGEVQVNVFVRLGR